MTAPPTDHDPATAAELYLRLLVEDAVAALPAPVDEVARRLSELVVASSALVAVGAIERDVAVGIARDAETALLVRGNEWMELDLGDLPDVRAVLDDRDEGTATLVLPDLVSISATDDVVVEQWSDCTRVRTSDGTWVLTGALDADTSSITISLGGTAREIPVTGGHRARHVDARVGPVDVVSFVASLDEERRYVAEDALRACGLHGDG